MGKIFHLLTNSFETDQSSEFQMEGAAEFVYSNNLCSEMSAFPSLLEGQIAEQDHGERLGRERKSLGTRIDSKVHQNG